VKRLDPKQAETELAKACIQAHIDLPENVDLGRKEDNSHSASWDVVVDQRLKEQLSRTGLEVWSEESVSTMQDKSTGFLLDPIDGTHMLNSNKPLWATQGVYLEEGEAVSAAVYAPKTGLLISSDGKTVNKKQEEDKPDISSFVVSDLLLSRSSYLRKRARLENIDEKGWKRYMALEDKLSVYRSEHRPSWMGALVTEGLYKAVLIAGYSWDVLPAMVVGQANGMQVSMWRLTENKQNPILALYLQ